MYVLYPMSATTTCPPRRPWAAHNRCRSRVPTPLGSFSMVFGTPSSETTEVAGASSNSPEAPGCQRQEASPSKPNTEAPPKADKPATTDESHTFASDLATWEAALDALFAPRTTPVAETVPRRHASPRNPGFSTPNAQVIEDTQAYHLEVELPGVPRDHVTLQWEEDRVLAVVAQPPTSPPLSMTPEADAGEATEEHPVEKPNAADEASGVPEGSIDSAEYVSVAPAEQEPSPASATPIANTGTAVGPQTHRRFARRFRFPHGINADDIKARLQDGLLSVTVPKATSVPRTIPISL
ncbi:hypothetical protein IWQ60_005673 [Tieghemiomyces parasiticus]|uniref:SHSP domain-containing protein n=1 Tax=Tieghemiomyces parasiticus TaxID=78921 RepID=A0A9W8A5V3_9FUNG|nr:hypothetical protein IWQ60_005673 [Tieghemiomyces parasiticus]